MEDPETGSLLSCTLLPPPAGTADALLRVPLPRERECDRALVGILVALVQPHQVSTTGRETVADRLRTAEPSVLTQFGTRSTNINEREREHTRRDC